VMAATNHAFRTTPSLMTGSLLLHLLRV